MMDDTPYCDCGQPATHQIIAQIPETQMFEVECYLCDECAIKVAQEQGEDAQDDPEQA